MNQRALLPEILSITSARAPATGVHEAALRERQEVAETNRWRSFGQRRVGGAQRPAELERPLRVTRPPVVPPGWVLVPDPERTFGFWAAIPQTRHSVWP